MTVSFDSATSTKTVSITPNDTLPTVTDTNGTTGWTEAAGLGANTAVVIDSGVTVTDPDNTTLASAKVSITTGFVSGQDVLAFNKANSTIYGNIAAVYNTPRRSQPDVSGIDGDASAVAGGAGRGDLQQHLAQSDRDQPHHQLRGQ